MTYALVTSSRSQNFYPAATVLRHYGEPRTIRGITIHWWGDPAARPTFEATVAYLCRAGGNTSAHYVAEDGRVAHIVADADAAWHAGSRQGNAETIGIECNPRQSDGDYATVATLIADLRAKYGDLPLYPHRHWFSTACPGTYDLARLDQLARGATTVGNPLTTGGTVTGVPTITPLHPLTEDDMFSDADRALLQNVENLLARSTDGTDIRAQIGATKADVDTVANELRRLRADLNLPPI